jgi:uncharacterized membrane protein
MPDGLTVLAFAAALGCGLVAGVFFAFSTFVMPALARLPSPQGIAAMQSINVKAINPWLMAAMFGTAAVCVALLVAALVNWDSSYGPFLLAGGAVYVLGTIWVTMAANVPRNNALARIDPDEADSKGVWAGYLTEWTAWNHVRTAAPLIAAGLEIGALLNR